MTQQELNMLILDTFYLEGPQRVSLRDKVFREAISNLLIHREYLNPSISSIEVRKDVVLLKKTLTVHYA